VTIDAALKARELGMTIVAGAPNIVQPDPLRECVRRRAVALDLRHPRRRLPRPSLLLAVQRLVDSRTLDLTGSGW
jgi:hypothetical protein